MFADRDLVLEGNEVDELADVSTLNCKSKRAESIISTYHVLDVLDLPFHSG